MAESLWEELEQMCGLIKHAPEHVNLGDVRVLLRRCQTYVNYVGETLVDTSVTIPGERLARLIEDAVATN